jgi:hypothetical protein
MKQKPKKDFLNQIFHGIKIIGWDEKRSLNPEFKLHYWFGQCLVCGQIASYTISALKARKSIGCGKCDRVLLIGKKFNRLTVKEYLGRRIETYRNNKPLYRDWFLCQCDCGNYIETTMHSLKCNNTKSCGCLMMEKSTEQMNKIHEKQLVDLTGQTSGYLTIERLATPEEYIGRPEHIRYWAARCVCGNLHIVGTTDFVKGKVQSCGCLLSKGEAKITKILTQNNIKFVKQYSFKDLRGLNKSHYSFDFAILNTNNELKYLIEYDGIQHFKKDHQFIEGDYEKIQRRDKDKNEYCLKNNIPLIRIPYTQFEKLTINDLLLETTPFLCN